MLRSLYSGTSGLRNHQVSMDVTSNNIANVNTTGYRGQRVTFKEHMYQTLQGATRPPGERGGTNPMQVGLGMGIGSVDTILSQGALESTGQITDLAIEGDAFFAFSDGIGTYYSRNGSLQLDGGGRLVSPTNGYTIQGLMADPDGRIPSKAVPGDVRIPFGEKAPANATSEVGFSSNLNKDSAGLGTILHTGKFLALAEGDNLLTGLNDQNGNLLNIRDDDTLRIDINDGAGSYRFEVRVGDGSDEIETMADLADWLEESLQDGTDGPGIGGASVTINGEGQLEIDGLGGDTISSISIGNATRPTSDTYVKNLFNWTSITGDNNTSSGQAMTPATEDHDITDLFDAAGRDLGLEPGDELNIAGSIGSETINFDPVVYGTDFTTMGEFLDVIQKALNLPETVVGSDGTDVPTVELNRAADGDKRAPAGAIMIRGQAQESFALNGIAISARNSNQSETAPNPFNSNLSLTEVQSARDTAVHATSIEVYDESGQAHTMTTTFTHTGEPNKWLWEISMEGDQNIISGNKGTIEFGQDGSPSSWTFDDGVSRFQFDPMNGSANVSLDLKTGSPGNFEGITQFSSPTTTAAKEQDGYAMGILDQISISEDGSVDGTYTNGTNKTIAKILVAEFRNPSGLQRLGDSMYGVSSNSGEAVLQEAQKGSTSSIKPGALEMSNVELSTEFTNLITIQKGYQANSRVITKSDQLLDELINLVR
ncbi:flagellar hook-basal body complex protein [Chitinivibrio alkaliphilus]|uniref:Flagellar hook protein FlgE n=1 Tax=Chitinivibrio alkaliphilus ACht1 TaxID=1313304 RepID=U7DCD0_9BACT|nr:flagellar hook-basal body complex protein [Chitinivibrio alkaliphilus]ERP32080.1 flagellar hook protein FlgE [Chitinivibrio alkaliphilus ACht1]